MLDFSCITIDTDWASDEAIKITKDLLLTHHSAATWFITHYSPEIGSLFNIPRFEIGIHPNFLSDSTQGKDPRDIVENLLDIAPAAKSVRTHGLMQSTRLLRLLAEYGLKYDVSLFMPGIERAQPYSLPLSEKLSITRIPYIWEDDVELYRNGLGTSFIEKPVPGVKVYNFHPVHVMLNTKYREQYRCYREYGSIMSVDSDKLGIRDILEFLIPVISNRTIMEVGKEYENSCNRKN